jgi:hypothetical protein
MYRGQPTVKQLQALAQYANTACLCLLPDATSSNPHALHTGPAQPPTPTCSELYEVRVPCIASRTLLQQDLPCVAEITLLQL